MKAVIEAGSADSTAARMLSEPAPDGGVALWWLGQAGFALRARGVRLLIDPYLSDWLEHKYAGTSLPHPRLLPTPLRPDQPCDLDAVLCSHAHGDHLDPWTVTPLAAANPACRFIVPRAAVEQAVAMPLDPQRIVGLNDGEGFELPGCTVQAVAAAHEQLEVNDRGEHLFLGYLLRLGNLTIYHSGDCVDYPHLAERLAGERIDLALLPVNGRGKSTSEFSVLGNFTLDEAVGLCRRAGIGQMIAHHYGMFDFNTVDVRELSRQVEHLDAGGLVLLPTADRAYVVRAG